ncbi:MAG: type IV pilus twitching motility protein PilT [Planctomycetota bacterium]
MTSPVPASNAPILMTNQENPDKTPEIDILLVACMKHNASDLHLKAGDEPILRIYGKIHRLGKSRLTIDSIERMTFEIMSPEQVRRYKDNGSYDFAYESGNAGRFRINVFRQRGITSVACRRVVTVIPKLEELHLPTSLRKIGDFDAGLVLVAGITGSGKSTTIASVVDLINHTQARHIVTVENPIEYTYHDDKSFINQREVGVDVPSFGEALKYVLRQDPDVIVIGEMRDAETFDTALMAAETGHLVFGTIHSSSAAQTISRVLDYFPQDKHHYVRQQLFFNLRAVIVQRLLRGIRPNTPRVPAVEIMYANSTIKKLINESEDHKIPDVIRGSTKDGMQDINQSLTELVLKKFVDKAEAMESSPNPGALEMALKGITLGGDSGRIIGG